jgi:hypothetical protein
MAKKAKGRSVSGATLLGRLKAAIGNSTNNPSIRVADNLDKYFQVPEGVIAFVVGTLNHWNGFKEDGLALQPANVRKAKTVADIHQAVKDWYKANGWTVT